MSYHDADNPAKELIMDAGDDKRELNPQEQDINSTKRKDSAGIQHQSNEEISTSTDDQSQLEIPKPHHESAEQQQPHDDDNQVPREQQTGFMGFTCIDEHREQELGTPGQVDFVSMQERPENTSSAGPYIETKDGDDFAMSNAQDDTATHARKKDEIEKVAHSESTQNEHSHLPVDIVPVLSQTTGAQVVAESLRGNPYAFATNLSPPSQSALPNDTAVLFDVRDSQHVNHPQAEARMTGESMGTQGTSMYQGAEIHHTIGSDQLGIETVFGDQHMTDQHLTDQHLGEGEDDEEESEVEEDMQFLQNDFSNGSNSDDEEEEDDEHMASIQAQLRAEVAKVNHKPRQQLSQEEMDFLNPARNQNNDHLQGYLQGGRDRHHEGYATPTNTQQHSVGIVGHGAYGAPSMLTSHHSNNSRYEGRQEITNHYLSRSNPRSMPGFSPHNSMYASHPTMGSQAYQRAPENHYQHAPLSDFSMNYPDMGFPMAGYGQQTLHSAFSPYPVNAYDMQAGTFSAHQPTNYASNSHRPDAQQRKAQIAKAVKEEDNTDGSLSPHGIYAEEDEHDCGGGDDDILYLRTLQKHTEASKPTVKAKDAQPDQRIPLQSVQTSSPTNVASESSTVASIDWTLPKYEAQFEPGKTKDDPTLAKISIPGLIREEILLSTDHGEQEAHLFVTCFLPAQEALATPDPHPAQAIVNFHTIAVMVIEAYVQYEIGDEYGTGRGHWHNDHDHGDADYQRLRDAKDADVDEIFFAVIDRWRAGIESGKESAKLIRGAQEFCDVALDVVFYIKEHGLSKQRQRAVRSDKGVKRGAKKVGEDEERVQSKKMEGKEKQGAVKGKDGKAEDGKIATTSKGVKRGAEKANVLGSRKKPKSTPAKSAAPKKPRKKKEPVITVLKAVPRKK